MAHLVHLRCTFNFVRSIGGSFFFFFCSLCSRIKSRWLIAEGYDLMVIFNNHILNPDQTVGWKVNNCLGNYFQLVIISIG